MDMSQPLIGFPLTFNGACPALLKRVDTDFFKGGFIEKAKRSVDHLKPKSKGGRNSITNYVVTDSFLNSQKSNKDLKAFIKPSMIENMRAYVHKYFNMTIGGIQNYGEQIAKTVKREAGIDLLA